MNMDIMSQAYQKRVVYTYIMHARTPHAHIASNTHTHTHTQTHLLRVELVVLEELEDVPHAPQRERLLPLAGSLHSLRATTHVDRCPQ